MLSGTEKHELTGNPLWRCHLSEIDRDDGEENQKGRERRGAVGGIHDAPSVACGRAKDHRGCSRDRSSIDHAANGAAR